MPKKIMTTSDLYQLCVDNKFFNFECKEEEQEIKVLIEAKAVFSEKDKDKHKEGLRPFVAKAYHDNVNLNQSKIKTEDFKENTKSAPYKPILANIVKNDKTGLLDFGGHDFTIDKDEDGNEVIIYQEKPVGVISTDYEIVYDEKDEVNRAVLKGYLYEVYCSDAVSILERRGNVDCSIELSVRSFMFDAEDKTLVLNDYCIDGLTLLGEEHKPGMKGSNVEFEDFENKNKIKEVYSKDDTTEKILEAIKELNEKFEQVVNTEKEEGGRQMGKFQELLNKYNKTEADIDFNYEEMTDEELEKKFQELFENKTDDQAFKKDKESVFEVKLGNYTFKRNISLSDKIYALNSLVNLTYGESDQVYYSVVVYETEVVMYDCWGSNKMYRQNYKEAEDNSYVLVGDRQEVFVNYLTKEEEEKINEMKSNYNKLMERVEEYESKELKVEKMKVFEDETYSEFLEEEEFKSLIDSIDKYSLEEVKDRAEIAFAKCIKRIGSFTLKESEKGKRTVGFKQEENKDKHPYQSLLD